MKKVMSFVLAGGLVLLAVSCGPKAGEDVAALIGEAQGLAREGNVDKALARLDPYYASNRYVDARPTLMDAMVRIELEAGRGEAALGRFKKAVTSGPELAEPAMGTIANHFVSRGLHQDLTRWCDSLQPVHFREETMLRLAVLHFNGMVRSGRITGLPAVFQGYLSRLPEAGALKLTQIYVSSMIRGRQWPLAEKFLEIATQQIKDSPARRETCANEKIDLVLARDGYKSASSELLKMLKELPDESVARNVKVVGDAVFAAGDGVAGDALFERVLKTLSGDGHEKAQEAAATGWMKLASRSGNAREMMDRLDELNQFKVNPGVVIQLINGAYSVLLGSSDQETFKRLFELCQHIHEGKLSHFDKVQVSGMMLDVSYFREDFDTSIKLIEAGAGAIREEQKPGMLAKVRAHLAMKNKQPREAAKYFREFMVAFEKQGQDEIDPVTSCRVTRSMVLGLNAKRIGDLMASAGDAAEARKAYDEARGYYERAIQAFPDPASLENRKISKELSELPR